MRGERERIARNFENLNQAIFSEDNFVFGMRNVVRMSIGKISNNLRGGSGDDSWKRD